MTEPDAATAMCECSHHWYVHAGSGQTVPGRPCWGYTGSATPGPYKPCPCTGFRQWAGLRDSRTGEPVRPLTMTVDARIKPDPGTAAGLLIRAARADERQRIRDGSQLRHDMGTNFAGVHRYYAVPADLLDGAS